jgi:hypothetical protein
MNKVNLKINCNFDDLEVSNNKKKLRCYFCNGNHICRNCPIEEKLAPVLKKKVGKFMEHYVANNLDCPLCKKRELRVLGNNSPSLDIICDNCDKNIEVKSKCLSVKKLPADVHLPHGNFSEYFERQKSGLDFIIVIYSVNRVKKEINIRKVLYMNDNIIKNGEVVKVERRDSSNLSTIKINNINSPKIKKRKIKRKNSFISFKKQVIDMINEHPIEK